MKTRSNFRLWLGLSLLLLILHAAVLTVPALRLAGSDVFIFLSSSLAFASCLWRASRISGPRVRFQWYLAATGIGLWTWGQAVFTYIDIRHLPQTVPLNSDLLFFLYGVPFLLAICTIADESWRISLLITDFVQAIVVAWLVERELFPAGHGGVALSTAHVYFAYNIENFLLLAVASLRLLTRARGARRQFYLVAFSFWALYATIALPLNYLNEFRNLPTGTPLDLFWDLPFLLLATLAAALPLIDELPAEPPVRRFERIIHYSMPGIITAVLLVMGTILVRYEYGAGLLAMLIGLGSYSLRNSLLEIRYQETQKRLTGSEAALQVAMERFQELSYVDPLTKVANRRQFEETIHSEWNRTMRRNAPLSLLMIDLDHFKFLNDTYGHMHGDDCLTMAAQTLSSHLKRAGEMLARYGGEEFAAILPDVPAEAALQVAESLRAAIEDLNIENTRSPHGGHLTVSIGVASSYPSASSSVEVLLASADRALYAAKQSGRNCVVATRDSGLIKAVRNHLHVNRPRVES